MAVARSPRYPSISLPEAIEKVRLVYRRDHLNTVPKEVIAAHMGYNSLNGKSLGIISAASKYGLLDGNRDGMNVTALALNIIATEPGSEDRIEAVKQAARSPALFEEIREQFPDGISDQALRSFLLTKKQFLPNAADLFIRGFRDTLEFEASELALAHEDNIQHIDLEPIESDEELLNIEESLQTAPSAADVSAALPKHATSGFDVGFLGDSIRISGEIRNRADAEKVTKALTALSLLLPDAT